VFCGAILASASALVVAHNHPSGDPAPSAADLHVTRKLRDAAKILEIEFLDHVIAPGCHLGQSSIPWVKCAPLCSHPYDPRSVLNSASALAKRADVARRRDATMRASESEKRAANPSDDADNA
jgi:hypothetical protein